MKVNFKKIELSKILSNKLGFSVLYSKKLIDDFINILSSNIKINNSTSLKNLGSFKIIQKKERVGRNPKTKKKYIISSRNSIVFYPSKKLLKKINC